ncbi:peptidase S8 and S53, subtilisin, kexin, sedolisin [Trichodesmium erythraeum IMS101]|uniref:Peptidase S8 and S53, subtilisin, kexin, sedolisin n=1 Tax=Trichodesmium erythraeum (strain IMS101) TaxID=203124 RepID=Q10Z63_TRIEI|nr:S8 family serine peptidase [Trichodesmium erythraeum GBRTRLIN201]
MMTTPSSRRVQNSRNNPPVADKNKITVYENSTDTPLGITAPTDPDGDPLTIRVIGLPRLGTVTKADGTEVKRRDKLTSEELVGLEYDAPNNYNGKGNAGGFFYFVNDGTSNRLGSTRITINPLPEDFKPGEVIVKLKDVDNKTSSKKIESFRDNLDIEVISTIEGIGVELWKLPNSTNVQEFVEEYSSRPEFDIQPNFTNTKLFTPNHPDDPDYNVLEGSSPPGLGRLWGLNNKGQTGGTDDADINAPEAWGFTTTPVVSPTVNSTVRVAVIDTGVDVNHPDLTGNLNLDLAANTIFGDDPEDVTDNHGHGTHVAGIIGAVGNNQTGVVGVNWDVEIVPIKAFDDIDGDGVPEATDMAILEAINYAINVAKVDIINASWGKLPDNDNDDNDDIAELWKNVIDNDTDDESQPPPSPPPLFVAAAGNQGVDIDDPENAVYPASIDSQNIISVAATDHDDNLSSFSNFGASVDLAAPGGSDIPGNGPGSSTDPRNIYSTLPNNDYGYSAGTSAAAAYVSGAAALMLGTRRARNEKTGQPDLSTLQLEEKLRNAITPINGLPTATGGRLNLYNGIDQEGIGWGDVHFTTFDGRKYDLQSFGDFIMAETARNDDDWVVQTRQQPWAKNSSVAVNTAFATRVDGKTVVFNQKFPNNRLQVGGVDFPLASGETKNIGDSKIERDGNKYTITYAGNDGIIDVDDAKLTAFDNGDHINIHISDFATMQGLLGNNDGNPNNDFALSDDTQKSNNVTAKTIHQEHGEYWRVPSEDKEQKGDRKSLFEDSAEVIGIPKRFLTLDGFPKNDVAAVNAKVKKAGITDKDRADAVAFDLLATEDETFLTSAVEFFKSVDEANNPDVQAPVQFDFNADGVADILWREEKGRRARSDIWFMNDDGTLNKSTPLVNYYSRWDVAGVGDFNADGVADILWRHKKYGFNYIWLMNDEGTFNSRLHIKRLSSSWNVEGVADFNGDGVEDIFWRNKSQNQIWFMNDEGKVNNRASLDSLGTSWDVAGVGDFNGDGVEDILLRDTKGSNEIWFMNDQGEVDNRDRLSRLSSRWDVAGVGDFNSDGVEDILWRDTKGSNQIWLMNDQGKVQSSVDPGSYDSAWDVAGVAEFNGDGVADILWRDENNGSNRIWLMNNDGTRNQIVDPGSLGSTWDVVGM